MQKEKGKELTLDFVPLAAAVAVAASSSYCDLLACAFFTGFQPRVQLEEKAESLEGFLSVACYWLQLKKIS